MSRLSIDLTEQQHKSLKAIAALQGKTIRQYAVERLFPSDSPGAGMTEDEAWTELSNLLQERIAAGLAGEVSTRTVADIMRAEIERDEAN
ncbi:antitoxin [Novosphingobium sp.]|uniref:antitoxin n=1 Tax=Novosphingobium sp. TaxID=1874826 RepID=UPI003BAD0513